jgi:hypothetical protein
MFIVEQMISTAPGMQQTIRLREFSPDIRLFVDLVYQGETAIDLKTFHFDAILRTCRYLQMFDFEKILWAGFRKSLRRRDCDVGFGYLWVMFRLAAGARDHNACSDIIMLFHDMDIPYDDVISRQMDFYEGIPSDFLATLLTGNFRYSGTVGGKDGYRERGFEDLSHRFEEMWEAEGCADLRTARPSWDSAGRM